MKYQITTDELLILRDGKPFGEVGTVGGGGLLWPYPQTIAGMVRTSIGHSKSKDYFDKKNPDFKNNIESILSIGINKLLPLQRVLGSNDVWQPVLPLPADIILTQDEGSQDRKLIINEMNFQGVIEKQGTDIKNKEWLLPFADIKEKQAKQQPFFCYWDFYENYLKSEIKNKTQKTLDEIGITAPVTDVRMHNALNDKTLTTEEGRLFCNTGFYLRSKSSSMDAYDRELSIYFEIENEQIDVSTAYLGGERKQVSISKSNILFPAMPDCFSQQSWLKIILTTPGDFGSWCPKWLQPNLTKETIAWVTIPDTTFNVRLRSACINGWEAVSGWDYVKREPKATKKLVKAGSVFVIEIKDKNQSEEIAQYFWGGSLGKNNTEQEKNGYNQCLVGKVKINKKENEEKQ